MKKFLALLLAGMMLLSMAACGNGDAGNSQQPAATPTQGAADNTTPPADPTDPPVEESRDLAAFYATMFPEGVASGLTLVPLEGDMLENAYPGLAAMNLKQMLVYTPLMSAVAFEVALVEADAADVATAKAILDARVSTMKDDQGNYPAVTEMWQTSSYVETEGNYLMLVVGEGAQEEVNQFHTYIQNGSLRDPAVYVGDDEDYGGGDEDDPGMDHPPIFVPGGPDNPGVGGEVPGGSDEEIVPVDAAPEGSVDLESFFDSVTMKHDCNLGWVDDMTLRDHISGVVTLPAYQRLYYIPAMTGVAQELLLMQLQNGEDVATLEATLNEYVQAMINGAADYPSTMEQWEKNARVVSNGNYVMLIVNADSDAIVEEFNALFA